MRGNQEAYKNWKKKRSGLRDSNKRGFRVTKKNLRRRGMRVDPEESEDEEEDKEEDYEQEIESHGDRCLLLLHSEELQAFPHCGCIHGSLLYCVLYC